MSLAILITSLEADLSRNLPRNRTSFAETRARRSELAPFETIADIRRALDPTSSKLTVDARRALVTALATEAQKGTSAIWSSLLVLAFAPMMHRLRKQTDARIEPNPDLDSQILVAFLSAVKTVRPGSYTSLALRWSTEKEVFHARRVERRFRAAAPFDEEIHSSPVFHETESKNTFEEVLRTLEKDGAAEILDVLIATRGRDESLRAYVVRTCPDPRERKTRYLKFMRARARLEREIRTRIAPRAA